MTPPAEARDACCRGGPSAKHRRGWGAATGSGDYHQQEHAILIVDAQVHIWGSGKPTNPSHRQVAVFSEELPWLSPTDKELIMGRAVCARLDWKLPR